MVEVAVWPSATPVTRDYLGMTGETLQINWYPACKTLRRNGPDVTTSAKGVRRDQGSELPSTAEALAGDGARRKRRQGRAGSAGRRGHDVAAAQSCHGFWIFRRTTYDVHLVDGDRQDLIISEDRDDVGHNRRV